MLLDDCRDPDRLGHHVQAAVRSHPRVVLRRAEERGTSESTEETYWGWETDRIEVGNYLDGLDDNRAAFVRRWNLREFCGSWDVSSRTFLPDPGVVDWEISARP